MAEKALIDKDTFELARFFSADVESLRFQMEDETNDLISLIAEMTSGRLIKIVFGFSGCIESYYSDNGGTDWVEYNNHANANNFGGVKLSDSYTATGAAASGLVPSQKALKDAIKPSSLSVTTASISGATISCEVWKAGAIVNVNLTVIAGSAISSSKILVSGLPHPTMTQAFSAIADPTAQVYVDSTGLLKTASSFVTGQFNFMYMTEAI